MSNGHSGKQFYWDGCLLGLGRDKVCLLLSTGKHLSSLSKRREAIRVVSRISASFELAKLSVTNLIGPIQCDQHMVRPCTFQDLPPFSSNTFYGLFTADVSSVATGQQLISFDLMLQQMHQLCFQLYICRANRGVCFKLLNKRLTLAPQIKLSRSSEV